jgi:hypothetical protein
LTPNRNLRITGSKIKLAVDNPACGVFFVNQATQERTQVEPSDVVNNKPSELIIVIPALPAGAYSLEVVTQFTVGTLLKEPRTALLNKVLTIA